MTFKPVGLMYCNGAGGGGGGGRVEREREREMGWGSEMGTDKKHNRETERACKRE